MEVVAKSNSKRMYSWWWDSHNTPKNSIWLHHNLADMDSNVKKMIKVLEEDADSFAMRAEMYYRKRPELMNLVEEFYRAYRALAERYNHATGVIHKAHQTIAEALPNQVPIIFGDPQEPKMLPPIRDRVDPDKRASKVEAETDKEASLVQTISNLEERLSKAEEKCAVLERSKQNLHFELDGLLEKLGNQSQKLTEKQTELVKLWSRVQEEHLRFQEAETAFQTLQQLHSQSQEELNNLAVELEQAKVENKDLNELNLSSVALVKSLQEDVSSLKETIKKLEAEVELRVDREHKARKTGDKFVDAETENLQLKRNLLSIRSDKDHLEDEIANVKDQLCEKEKELEEIKLEKEKLNHEVVKDSSQAATFFCDKKISAVHETLITATRHDQAEACNNLEKLKRSQAIVLLNDGSSYEIVSKKGNLELLDDHSFFELKPVKTETTVKAKGKSLSEESLVVDKLEIFDGFMDPNIEVNKRKVVERLRSDQQKLENLQITVKDLKHKVETDDEYTTIKGKVEEAEEAIEKLFNVNLKLTTKAESEKDCNRSRRISEHARRGSEKIGRLQLEIQRIQFMLMKIQGEKVNRVRSMISDKVLLRDYIYGRSRSVTMKKKTTKKRSAFCGCAQQPRSP